jgi:hypothetical protein
LRLDNKPLPLDDYSSSAPLRDLLSLLEQYDMPSVRLIEFIARHRVNLLRTLLEKGGD